jgi:ferredoxin
MDSPFEVLLLDSDATEEDVVRAYRERVKEVHPDQGGSIEEFRAVKQAYDELLSMDLENGDHEFAREGEDEDDEVIDESLTHVEYLNYEVLDDFGWDLDDEDLFEKAAEADLSEADHGEVLVESDTFLLASTENSGLTWPFSCRGGACANCAVKVFSGELSIPANHILPDEMLEQDIYLSCVGEPLTDELQIVYNIKHLPELEDLRLPPGPYKGVAADD